MREEPLKTSLPPGKHICQFLASLPCESLFVIPCAINPLKFWKLRAKVLTFAGVAQQMGWAMPADLLYMEKTLDQYAFEETNMTGTDD